MAGGRKGRGCEAPLAEQEQFIRENAVALVRDRDAKIARLRKRVTQLEQSVRGLREELRRAKGGG
jgi:uncharacterized protein involved in exopolysaccharide biosynthesis